MRIWTLAEKMDWHDFNSPTINDTFSLRAELVKSEIMEAPLDKEEDED